MLDPRLESRKVVGTGWLVSAKGWEEHGLGTYF